MSKTKAQITEELKAAKAKLQTYDTANAELSDALRKCEEDKEAMLKQHRHHVSILEESVERLTADNKRLVDEKYRLQTEVNNQRTRAEIAESSAEDYEHMYRSVMESSIAGFLRRRFQYATSEY